MPTATIAAAGRRRNVRTAPQPSATDPTKLRIPCGGDWNNAWTPNCRYSRIRSAKAMRLATRNMLAATLRLSMEAIVDVPPTQVVNG